MSKPKTTRKTKPKKAKQSTPGDLIRTTLDKEGMNTAALAKAAGLSPSFLSLVMSGKRQLSPSDIAKVAGVLKLKPSDLLSSKQRDDLKALQSVAG